MRKYIVRRILYAIPTLIGISVIVFAISRLAPGDPVRLYTFGATNITEEDIAALRHFYGLWFERVVPVLGKILPGGSAYTYLPASVRRFPGPEELVLPTVAMAEGLYRTEATFRSAFDECATRFREHLAVDLRDLINEGYFPGPRIVASGPCISITGGHCDLNHYPPNVRVDLYPLERDFHVADGADQLRHVIRAHVQHGVDVIKVAASGGVFSRGDTPGAPQFTYEELRVAVEEAHKAGRRIAAHAHGTQSIKDATRAGIDSIEHGTLIDDEGIRLMKERGTFLVGDVYNDDYILAHAEDLRIPREYVDKERAIGQIQRDNWAKAVKAGVRVAFGTDAGIYPHGDNAKQFAWMVRLGLSPARAILSATAWAAELLDRQKDIGTVQAGRYADLIAVPGDPLKDVRVLERVPFVMKGGAVIKDELSATSAGPASSSSSR